MALSGQGENFPVIIKKLAESPIYYLNITNFIRLKKQLYEKDATDHDCAGTLRRMQRERCQ